MHILGTTELKKTLPMDQRNPWKDLSNKTIYENPWMEVSHREVIDPSGKQGIYGKVHFKNMAIGVLPLDTENYTWLVGQYRYPLDQYSWEIPEGGCPLGTPPLETAKKELQEETGIFAQKWTKILDIHTSNSITDEYGIAYLAQDLTFGNSNPESCEELVVKKVHLEEAYEMVMNGTITDSISMVAIMKVKLMLF